MSQDPPDKETLRALRVHLWFNTGLLVLLILGFLFGHFVLIGGLAVVALFGVLYAAFNGIVSGLASRDSHRELTDRNTS